MLRTLCKLKNIGVRNKSFNSDEWMKRHQTDIYVIKAKRENYRCRSAFKLLEIDDKYKLLQPGFKVLDVGAAPGSWSQILATKTNSNGKDPDKPKGLVIAVDLSKVFDIEGVITLSNMDFTKKDSQEKILKILNGDKLDFIFSDMAPNSTGVKSLDQENILNLIYPVFIFAVKNLKIGGGLLVKVWEGNNSKLVEHAKKFFRSFKFVKPNSSYSTSSELYWLARDFVGIQERMAL